MSKPAWICAALLAAGAANVAAGPGEALIDPTRPTPLRAASSTAETARPAGPRWRLQSTLVARERRVAIINGRAVAQGHRIDGATVQEVRADGVILDVAGQRVDLRLRRDYGIRRTEGVKP